MASRFMAVPARAVDFGENDLLLQIYLDFFARDSKRTAKAGLHKLANFSVRWKQLFNLIEIWIERALQELVVRRQSSDYRVIVSLIENQHETVKTVRAVSLLLTWELCTLS